jgi:hypothetical protein
MLKACIFGSFLILVIILSGGCKHDPVGPSSPNTGIDTVSNGVDTIYTDTTNTDTTHTDTTFTLPGDTLTSEDLAPCVSPCAINSCIDTAKSWLFALDSCRKKKFPYVSGPGYQIVDTQPRTIPYTVNPQNTSEIIYWTGLYGGENTFIFDMCTGIKRTLNVPCESSLISWGSNGWLLFSCASGLWKMKPNGDSLTQIPGVSENVWRDRSPAWRPFHTDFLYESDFGVVIAQEDGTPLDTFTLEKPVWSFDGKRVFGKKTNGNSVQIIAYELDTKAESIILQSVSRNTTVCSFTDENHILWLDGINNPPGEDNALEILKTNIHTLETSVFTKMYVNMRYQVLFRPSPDGAFLYSQFSKYRFLQYGELEVNRYVAFINSDGSCEIIGDFNR